MFIPLSAGQRAYTKFPIATAVIILVNAIVFLWQTYLYFWARPFVAYLAIWEWGFNPAMIVARLGHRGLTLFSSQYLHVSLEHIFFNMLFLWVFGPMVEDITGSIGFLIFYTLCGVAGNALTVLLDPGQFIPNVGASGAIAGVMGAFLLLYPGRRIRTLIFVILPLFPRVPAWVILIYWIVQEIVLGELILARGYNFTGVGVWAHIGGFFGGLLLVFLFIRKEVFFNRESALQFVRH